MTDSPLRTEIVRILYDAWARGEKLVDLRPIAAERSWDSADCTRTVDRLVHEGWIEHKGLGQVFSLTAEGVIGAEKKEIVPSTIVKENDRIRAQALGALANVYKNRGPTAQVRLGSLVETLGIEHEPLLANLRLLQEATYVEQHSRSYFSITIQGLDALDDYFAQEEIEHEFERIAALDPQSRGRALQGLICTIAKFDGWGADQSIRTPGEEIDVILSRDREHCLVECKWEKQPVGAAVVREFFGKLENRTSVKGLLMSMPGFAKTASHQVLSYAGKQIILLYGRQDIQYLVEHPRGFTNLLNEKLRDLSTRRVVSFR